LTFKFHPWIIPVQEDPPEYSKKEKVERVFLIRGQRFNESPKEDMDHVEKASNGLADQSPGLLILPIAGNSAVFNKFFLDLGSGEISHQAHQHDRALCAGFSSGPGK